MEKEPLTLTAARFVFYSLIQFSVIPKEDRDDACHSLHSYSLQFLFPVFSILGGCMVRPQKVFVE